MSNFSQQFSELLEPLAAWFRNLGTPELIIHWGHPFMMGVVVFVMGGYVGWAGWRSRLAHTEAVANKNRADHRQLAPLMSLFIALGYTGGILSLVMQHQRILESPHFWTGSTVLILLAINGAIAFLGFGRKHDDVEANALLRKVHAYLGSITLGLLLVHAGLGLRLGLLI